MLPAAPAQALADGLAAIALGAAVLSRLRGGTTTPLDLRLMFAFGGLSFFFAFRAAADMSSVHRLHLMAQLMVAPLMIAGLALAEGVLRRHAPRLLKGAITLGGLALGAALIVSGGHPPVTTIGLGGYVTLSLLAMTVLVFARDRASLSAQENASIDALLMALGALTLLAATDFLPGSPIGMSGLGAALLALFARGNSTSWGGVRRVLGDFALIGLAACLFTVALAQSMWMGAGRDNIRLGVVVSGLLVAVTMALGAWHDRPGRDEAQAFRRALSRADLSSLPAFLESLVSHPLLHGLVLAEGASLADYDTANLLAALRHRPVWRRLGAAEKDGHAAIPGAEELCDLMARTESTHAALVSAAPLRVALLTLPEFGPADEAETDFALFCKLAAIAAEMPA